MECRLCLYEGAQRPVFVGPNSIASQINSLLNFQVRADDGLPDKICVLCESQLKSFMKFKIVCEQTDRLLRIRVNHNVKIKKEVVTYEDGDLYNAKLDGQYKNVDDVQENVKTENDCMFQNVALPSFIKSESPFESNEISFYATSPLIGRSKSGKINSREDVSSKSKPAQLPCSSKTYVCSKCNKQFDTKGLLNRHMVIHSAYYLTCETCKKSFKLRKDLIKHEKSHSSDKTYECEICNRVFAIKGRWENHTLTHSRVHSCGICGKIFKRAVKVREHIDSVHLNKRKYQCDTCGKLFYSRRDYIVHIDIHSGISKFECDYCGKKVNYKHSLINHIRTHTGEKPYKCDYCFRPFALIKTLKSHILQHTGENPIKCAICHKGFKQMCNLKSHLRHYHKLLVTTGNSYVLTPEIEKKENIEQETPVG